MCTVVFATTIMNFRQIEGGRSICRIKLKRLPEVILGGDAIVKFEAAKTGVVQCFGWVSITTNFQRRIKVTDRICRTSVLAQKPTVIIGKIWIAWRQFKCAQKIFVSQSGLAHIHINQSANAVGIGQIRISLQRLLDLVERDRQLMLLIIINRQFKTDLRAPLTARLIRRGGEFLFWRWAAGPIGSTSGQCHQ